MESFDQFFLFITSVFGLFFSLFYALLGYQEIVYGFLPLLLIGLVIPIYVGYVRGAILLDMLEERVRGWVYFLIGVIYYLATIILFIVSRLLQVLNIEFEPLSGLLFFVGMVLLGYFLGWRKLYRWFCGSIFEAFNHKMTKLTEKIYDDTSSSAYFTSLYLYVAFNISLSENLDVALALMMLFLILGVVGTFALFERYVRKWVSLIRFSDFIEIESKKVVPRISSRVVRVLYLVWVIVVGVSMLFWERLPRLWSVGLIAVVSGSWLFISFLAQEKHIPVVKKDVPKDIETELTKLIDRIAKKKEKEKREKK